MPMDVILNELSLAGQYGDTADFFQRGLVPLTDFLRMVYTEPTDNKVSLLKKSDTFNSLITPEISLYQLLFSSAARLDDRIRQFKSYIAKLQNEPYWDTDPHHNPEHDYIRIDNGHRENVSSSGVAECHARDGYLLSFIPSDYEPETVTVNCVQFESVKEIPNSCEIGRFVKERYLRGEIDITEYMSVRHSSRFDFSEIDTSHGLNLISNLNFDIFDSSFENFSRKSWQQIETDDALDYKRFSKNRNTRRYFSDDQWKQGVFKFRIDQEKRCFGIRRGDIFYVWRIDLDHRLSDKG